MPLEERRYETNSFKKLAEVKKYLSCFDYMTILQDNQIIDMGKFIFIEVFQLINEGIMRIQYHHFAILNKIMY